MNNSKDFAKLRILNSFLETYQYQLPRDIPDSGELSYKCINPKCKSHLKKKDKFSINLFKESAHCWVCDTRFGNIGLLVKKLKPILLTEWNQNSEKRIVNQKLNSENPEEIIYYDNVFNEFKNIDTLKDNHLARIYLRSRFINLKTAKLFNIKYVSKYVLDNKFSLKNFVCVPSHSINGIDFLFFRSVDSKFKINTKSKKINIIFNDLFINWNQPICLVEGVFDSIRMFDYIQAIPLLGSSLSKGSKLFEKIIRKKPIVYVCLDPDALEKQVRICDFLSKWGIQTLSIEMVSKDLGDSSNEEIENILEKNVFSFNTTYKIIKNLNF